MGLMEDSCRSHKCSDRRKSADRKSSTPDMDSRHSHKSGARQKSTDRKSLTPDKDPAEVDQEEEEVILDDIDEADKRRLTVQMELNRLKARQPRRIQKRDVKEVPATAEDDTEEPPTINHEILDVQ